MVFYSASQSRNEGIRDHCFGEQHLPEPPSSNKDTTRPAENSIAVGHKSKASAKTVRLSSWITPLSIPPKSPSVLGDKSSLGADQAAPRKSGIKASFAYVSIPQTNKP